MNDYTIQITSNRPHLAKETIESFKPIKANYFNGEGYPSCSQLWNHAIVDAKTEIVIISNDKARPTVHHVNKMLKLIDDGYGVAGRTFGFFGFKKELIRKIGFFDERYHGGGHEDVDFTRRLKDANIAIYETLGYEVSGDDELRYEIVESSWHTRNTNHHIQKWGAVQTRELLEKGLEEEVYEYEIGPSLGDKFLPWSESKLLDAKYHGLTDKPPGYNHYQYWE